MQIVLIVGSAPDAVRVKSIDLSLFNKCVAINNAWQLKKKWDYVIYPEDFPVKKQPTDKIHKAKLITAKEYVPTQNNYGGFVYAGGTMAFTAGYWALAKLKPDMIVYLGCDMIYSKNSKAGNHFYGNGAADPFRDDITLQSLEAKSARLMAFAKLHDCAVVNLSEQPKSRLLFPRISIKQISSKQNIGKFLNKNKFQLNLNALKHVLKTEKKLGYMVRSGRYWEEIKKFDPSKLSEIDHLWLKTPLCV